MLRAMGTAEHAPATLHTVTDNSAGTMIAGRRQGLNRALKAVKGVPRTTGNQFKGLVVFIATNFAFSHKTPLLNSK